MYLGMSENGVYPHMATFLGENDDEFTNDLEGARSLQTTCWCPGPDRTATPNM
jgi:hypothetical protein